MHLRICTPGRAPRKGLAQVNGIELGDCAESDRENALTDLDIVMRLNPNVEARCVVQCKRQVDETIDGYADRVGDETLE
jgi:hypothetical protein